MPCNEIAQAFIDIWHIVLCEN